MVPILYMNILAYPVDGSISQSGGVRFTCINLTCQYLARIPLVRSRADRRLTHQTKWRPTFRFDLTTAILQNIVFFVSHEGWSPLATPLILIRSSTRYCSHFDLQPPATAASVGPLSPRLNVQPPDYPKTRERERGRERAPESASLHPPLEQ